MQRKQQDRTEAEQKAAKQALEKAEDERSWADDAAKARTSDDPRARTPRDAAGQPTDRSFDG